jgi:hypothetical protein
MGRVVEQVAMPDNPQRASQGHFRKNPLYFGFLSIFRQELWWKHADGGPAFDRTAVLAVAATMT